MCNRDYADNNHRTCETGRRINKYVRIKNRVFPVSRLVDEISKYRTNRLLDIGCGNGFIASSIKARCGSIDILGIDANNDKLEIARDLFRDIRFENLSIDNVNIEEYDSVIISDVLYLVEFSEQERWIRKVYDNLKPGSYLFIKEMDVQPRWKYLFNYVQELIAVKLVHYTYGDKFYFRSSAEYMDLFGRVGFSKIKCIRLDRGYFYPHILYILCK